MQASGRQRGVRQRVKRPVSARRRRVGEGNTTSTTALTAQFLPREFILEDAFGVDG